jgi:hypothetical protein
MKYVKKNTTEKRKYKNSKDNQGIIKYKELKIKINRNANKQGRNGWKIDIMK